jgi:phasin family protein
MAVRKRELTRRPLEVTASAGSPGGYRGKEQPAVPGSFLNKHTGAKQTGELNMDGSTSMTMSTAGTMTSLAAVTDQLTSFNQGNIEAIMKSSQVWTSGYHAISKTMAETAQSHLSRTASAWQALMGVKSLKEAMELPATLTHTSFETTLAETGKLTDASLRLVRQAMAPIAERVTVAVENLTHLGK